MLKFMYSFKYQGIIIDKISAKVHYYNILDFVLGVFFFLAFLFILCLIYSILFEDDHCQ